MSMSMSRRMTAEVQERQREVACGGVAIACLAVMMRLIWILTTLWAMVMTTQFLQH